MDHLTELLVVQSEIKNFNIVCIKIVSQKVEEVQKRGGSAQKIKKPTIQNVDYSEMRFSRFSDFSQMLKTKNVTLIFMIKR